jgi:hypothetical protein
MAERKDDALRIFNRLQDLHRLEREYDGDVDKVICWWQSRLKDKEERKQSAGWRLRRERRRHHLKVLLVKWAARNKT